MPKHEPVRQHHVHGGRWRQEGGSELVGLLLDRGTVLLAVTMQEQMPDLVRDRGAVPEHVLAAARRRDDDWPLDNHNRKGVDSVDLAQRANRDDDAVSLHRSDQVLNRTVRQGPVVAERNCCHRRRRAGREDWEIDIWQPHVALKGERQFPDQGRCSQSLLAVADAGRTQAAEMRVHGVYARQRASDVEELRAHPESARQAVHNVGPRGS